MRLSLIHIYLKAAEADVVGHDLLHGTVGVIQGQQGMVQHRRLMAPVSYTHLDVYKRQAMPYANSGFCGGKHGNPARVQL